MTAVGAVIGNNGLIASLPTRQSGIFPSHGQTGRNRITSCLPTSMISPCQEGKSSPDALGRSAGKKFFRFLSSRSCLSAVVPLRLRTRQLAEWTCWGTYT